MISCVIIQNPTGEGGLYKKANKQNISKFAFHFRVSHFCTNIRDNINNNMYPMECIITKTLRGGYEIENRSIV